MTKLVSSAVGLVWVSVSAALVFADAPSGTATFKYNPLTGEVVIEIGSGLGVVGFETDGLVDITKPRPTGVQQFDKNVVAFFNPSGIATGIRNLGPILPLDYLFDTDGRYPGQPRVPVLVFGFTPIGGASIESAMLWRLVPEPGSAHLVIGVAACVVGARRESRRRMSVLCSKHQ